MQNCRIITVGASAGGISALRTLFAQLPRVLDAAFFIVIHTSAASSNSLAALLNEVAAMPAKTAEDGEAICPGHIYIGPPDLHMLVKADHVRLYKGPHENRHRPAIDPTFRSAAVAHQTNAIGIILTGFLDDGTSGLLAIKRCGGVAIVQDPEEAEYSDMPRNAIAAVEADYTVPLSQMGSILETLIAQPVAMPGPIPDDVAMEARIAEQAVSNISREQKLGSLVPFGCPDCGGPLWQIESDQVRRYRCHTGHGFTAKALLDGQNDALEQALWAAMRTMEEQANITATLAQDEKARGRTRTAEMYQERADVAKSHAKIIRQLLTDQSGPTMIADSEQNAA